MTAPIDRHASRSLPVWMAALLEVGRDGCIDWQCISGRAVFTNRGAGTVFLGPLNVRVPSAHTVIVSWQPGATAYTVELRRTDALAA